MQRYFIDVATPPSAVISGDDARHIERVMRMKEGQQIITVFNDKAYLSEIVSFQDNDVHVTFIEPLERKVELPVNVTIACGLPKGDKLDLVIQKSTELGMAGFIPFAAERSIVQWDSKKWSKKQERFEKIAKEAAEQSHRTKVPTIHDLHTMKQLVNNIESYDLVLICDEEEAKLEKRLRFADHIKKVYDNMSILIVFGPEGGLSRTEVEQLSSKGAFTTTLGPRILRAETAPLYALAAISYELE